ncbi:MAG: hypothetical protein LCI00_29245 [Chloroflexi bacterium]|nr:hypothetical protein [Chloroflexota bacterium]MCC6894780.1 hypothetical protein [Anaerolineae bacterium]
MPAATPKTKLFVESKINRAPYFRRAWLSLLGCIVAILAIWGLYEASNLEKLPSGLWLPLTIVVALGGLLFLIRALVNLVRWFRTKDETLKLFNKGIVRTRNGQNETFGWGSIKTYREGSKELRLTMKNGDVLTIDRRYGEFERWASYIRRYAAQITGVHIARAIREERPVHLHPKLVVWPGGVEVDKKEIPWADVEARLNKGKLTIYQKSKAGGFQKVRQYKMNTVDNIGGFLEVAHSTMKNHQRERFGV